MDEKELKCHRERKPALKYNGGQPGSNRDRGGGTETMEVVEGGGEEENV